MLSGLPKSALVKKLREFNGAPMEAQRFGNQTLLREVSRDMWSFISLKTLFQDLRYGVRMLLKNPGFTLIAVITLALGIGANTAIFSLTSAIVLRPFDFRDLDRLVCVYETAPQLNYFLSGMSPADFADLRRQQKGFAELAASRLSNSNLTGAGEPERVRNTEVTAGFFRLLGVEAALGRAFLPEEEQAGRGQVAVLGHGLWQRRFGADPKIVGATISLDEKAYTVIGVMPEGFDFPKPVELWTPLALGNEAWNERREQSLQVVARLKAGVELGQVNAEVETLAARLAEQYPQTNAGRGATVRLLRKIPDNEINAAFLGLLMAAAGFVLLLACVNIANMQLARASSRSREMAVRAALGARRLALVRQLLTESLLLGLLGGVCGLLVSFGLLSFIRGSIPLDLVQYIPGWENIRVNERAMTFTLVISLASSVVFGLVPSLRSSNPNLNEALKEGGRSDGGGAGGQRMRKALIVAEVALALALLVGAGLLVKGFARMTEKQQKGFDPRHALTLRVTLPPSRYADGGRIAAFHRQAQERLSALPGVESASSTSFLPGSGRWNSTEFQIEGRPAPPPGQEHVSSFQNVGADYFRTVRIPVIKGREFSADDVDGTPPVAVISETLARRYFPNEDPLGHRVKVGAADSAGPWYTIVGVAGDVQRFMLDREIQPMLYVPNQQFTDREAYVVVRASGAPMAALPAVRAQIAALDNKLPLYEIKSHERVIADRMAGLRLIAALMVMFGALALVLASVGVYGVMAYAVSQRTREIGVRVALGARPQDVLRLIVGQSLKLAAIGLAIGLPVALAIGRVMAGALFGVVALEPMTFVGFTLLLTGMALLAAYLPARRAMRVDPMLALRFE
jgi:putative ABC transport system permease protein